MQAAFWNSPLGSNNKHYAKSFLSNVALWYVSLDLKIDIKIQKLKIENKKNINHSSKSLILNAQNVIILRGIMKRYFVVHQIWI